MIPGNPNVGKRTAAAVLTLAVVMILITLILSARKRTAR
jgi:hypothetical protein